MNRRECLTLLAAAAVLTRPGLATGSESAPERHRRIRDNLGFQIFTVRGLMQEDPGGTLRELAAIGYRELELVGFGGSIFLEDPLYGYSPQEFRKLLDGLGLRVPTSQFSGRAKDLPAIAATAREIGIEYLVLGMAPEFLSMTADGPVVSGVTGLDQIERIAERLNGLGDVFRQNGVGFAYHNHHMEFVDLDGRVAYDVLVELTDPNLVKLELDVGWCKVAGVDGNVYLDRYPDRYIACHFKDFDSRRPRGERSARSPIPEMTQLVAPGEGTVKFAQVLAAMDRAGVPHGYVEVDLPEDALEAARRGYRYLRGLDYAA